MKTDMNFVDAQTFRHIVSMEEVFNLPPHVFEYFAKHLLEAIGYTNVRVTRKEGMFHSDGGVDITAQHNGYPVVAQCKKMRWGRGGYMPIEHVRALGGSMKEYNAQEGVFVSTLRFGKHAQQYARNVGITLVGPREIAFTMQQVNPDFRSAHVRLGVLHHFITFLELRKFARMEIMPRIYALLALIVLVYTLPYIFPFIMRSAANIVAILQG